MQGRRIVDAITKIADRMADTLQRADDALLLLRIDLDEERGPFGKRPERLILECGELFACEHGAWLEAYFLGDMGGNITVVASNHLDRDAQRSEIADGTGGVRLDGITKEQESNQAHLGFVVAVIALL